MNTNQPVPDSSVPRRISWLTVVLALLAIGTYIAIANPGWRQGVPMGVRGVSVYTGGSEVLPPVTGGSVVVGGAGVTGGVAAPMMDNVMYYRFQNKEISANDTREFLKLNYGATMLSRDVQGLTRRVETTVRGYAGRVDQEASSPQYGFVSFVVPQSKYDAFRAELESLVGSRFLSVNVSSQNLLPQKVSIEEQQKQADALLAGYVNARQKLVAAHAAAVKSLNTRIAAAQYGSDEWLMLTQQLANENTSYAARLSVADANIKYARDRQKAVQTQDQALLDSVATVNGTVSIRWVGLWDLAQLYLPGYWIPAIFAALSFCSYLWDRRRWERLV